MSDPVLEELIAKGRRMCWSFDVSFIDDVASVSAVIGTAEAHKPFELSAYVTRGTRVAKARELARRALHDLPALIKKHGGPPKDRIAP